MLDAVGLSHAVSSLRLAEPLVSNKTRRCKN